MTDDQSRRRDALDNLTDALCEDILKAPGEELLAEVAEDYGDRRALAMGFDRIFARVQQDSGRLDAVSRIRRITFAIRKSGISLLARKKEAPSTQDERLSLLGARDWQGTRRQATVHSSRTTQEWFASREFSASIREVDSLASGRGQAVCLSEEFQPPARYRTLQGHTQTPQSDQGYQRIQGYQRVEFQRQRRRLMAFKLVGLAFVATAGIFGYHSLTKPPPDAPSASPESRSSSRRMSDPSQAVMKVRPIGVLAELSARGGENTRFDFGPAGSQLGGDRFALYQVQPVIKAEQAPTNHWAPTQPGIKAEQAPTKVVPREEQPVDFESFPRALHWAPPSGAQIGNGRSRCRRMNPRFTDYMIRPCSQVGEECSHAPLLHKPV